MVAFEVDSYEADGRTGWSVMVQGMASEVTDPVSLREVDSASLDAWELDGAADHIMRIELHMERPAVHQLTWFRAFPYSMKDHQTDTSEREPPWPNQ